MLRRELTPTGWPAGLDSLLARVPGDVGPDWYRREHEAGRLQVLRLGAAHYPDAWFLVRQEAACLVVVAAVAPGLAAHPGIAPEALAALEALARRRGFTSLRIHTTRPGLMVILLQHGWQQIDTVFRRQLDEAA